MLKCEILTVGDELLDGTKVNTNSTWIADTLTKTGVKIKKITTVGDETQIISEEIKRIIKKGTDLLIITGGLGPTPDDRTLKGLGKALDDKLELNDQALGWIRESYDELAEEGIIDKGGITPSRKKMASIPESSDPIPNPVGAAPAVLVKKDETTIFCLPGVPREMKAILQENLDTLNLVDSEEKMHTLEMVITSVGESVMNPFYKELMEKFPEIELRSYPEGYEQKAKLRVKISAKNKEFLVEAKNYLEKQMSKRLDKGIEHSEMY